MAEGPVRPAPGVDLPVNKVAREGEQTDEPT